MTPMHRTLLGLAFLASAYPQTFSRPVVNSIFTASAFGGYSEVAAPGSYVEIYGSNLAGSTRSWAAADFTGFTAPVSLDGVTVSINGAAAYVSYVSPTQVNAEIPDDAAIGSASVVVSYQNQASVPVTLNIASAEPGLLAPASFKVGSTVSFRQGCVGRFRGRGLAR